MFPLDMMYTHDMDLGSAMLGGYGTGYGYGYGYPSMFNPYALNVFANRYSSSPVVNSQPNTDIFVSHHKKDNTAEVLLTGTTIAALGAILIGALLKKSSNTAQGIKTILKKAASEVHAPIHTPSTPSAAPVPPARTPAPTPAPVPIAAPIAKPPVAPVKPVPASVTPVSPAPVKPAPATSTMPVAPVKPAATTPAPAAKPLTPTPAPATAKPAADSSVSARLPKLDQYKGEFSRSADDYIYLASKNNPEIRKAYEDLGQVHMAQVGLGSIINKLKCLDESEALLIVKDDKQGQLAWKIVQSVREILDKNPSEAVHFVDPNLLSRSIEEVRKNYLEKVIDVVSKNNNRVSSRNSQKYRHLSPEDFNVEFEKSWQSKRLSKLKDDEDSIREHLQKRIAESKTKEVTLGFRNHTSVTDGYFYDLAQIIARDLGYKMTNLRWSNKSFLSSFDLEKIA